MQRIEKNYLKLSLSTFFLSSPVSQKTNASLKCYLENVHFQTYSSRNLKPDENTKYWIIYNIFSLHFVLSLTVLWQNRSELEISIRLTYFFWNFNWCYHYCSQDNWIISNIMEYCYIISTKYSTIFLFWLFVPSLGCLSKWTSTWSLNLRTFFSCVLLPLVESLHRAYFYQIAFVFIFPHLLISIGSLWYIYSVIIALDPSNRDFSLFSKPNKL